MAHNDEKNQSERQPQAQSLLTKKSLALSLSAPRAPPHDSAHRNVLLGKDPSKAEWIRGYRVKELDSEKGDSSRSGINDKDEGTLAAHSFYPHQTLRQRLRQRFLRSQHSDMPHRLHRHPHLPTGPELGDQITRTLGLWLPHAWTHTLRDEGYFRSICDGLTRAVVPLIGALDPRSAREFLRLTRQCQKFVYGSDLPEQQYVDVFLPSSRISSNGTPLNNSSGRLVFFLHGGAWGSGRPWMYRLCALPFLQQGWAVAIPCYRTYPDGKAPEQVQDAEAALAFVHQQLPQYCGHVTFMGHSSGAHIGLLLLAERAKQVLEQGKSIQDFPTIDSFVGLSGPYDISHHFDYEAARGVEELSPMKPSCGVTREGFRLHSPALRLLDALANAKSEQNVAAMLPPEMLLLHSIEDETVPFTSTAEAARVLRSCGVTQCQEFYVGPGSAHSDTVLQLMRGGPTRDAVIAWMTQPRENASSSLYQNSRL